MRNNTSLRRCIEKLAKSAYQSQGDPLDAAIYYLAMKKKNLVWGLFRQVQNERMTAFFSNNFTEERWRKAALKNAYALLGKQRFDHAVAFFLLAGSLKGNDLIVLFRLYSNRHLKNMPFVSFQYRCYRYLLEPDARYSAGHCYYSTV